ncbi:putative RNA-binding protein [Spiroplasma gladiatoris]|uniref:Putative RNA-binding protein n=1 Tax=Spiroplasma gladiatoris TaxID=2143 RepID=A0A4V1AQ81_9MOLU|nr:YlxR family protein [Spiroplasma gladiatoris]QBQ07579.1 putative RNA-binding protein [Spiroplasma gladiatoris]
MQDIKHKVLRKDVCSNKMLPKVELIRVVKNKEGQVFVDSTKKANGRGVYLKPTLENVEKLKKTRALERFLKTKIEDQIYENLILEIKNNWD